MANALEISDFTKYAENYDLMLRYKPSYHKILDTVLEALKARYPSSDTAISIGDFGAGTGTLAVRLGETYPKARIHAVEFNGAFLSILKHKSDNKPNIIPLQGNVEHLLYPNNTFDAISMVHVLRLTKHAQEGYALQRVYEQLKDGGLLVISDVGRKLDIKRHAQEIFTCAYKNAGIMMVMKLIYKNIEQMRFNRKVEKQKQCYHTLDDFCRKIEKSGFHVIEARDDLYLGDDDFVVARK